MNEIFTTPGSWLTIKEKDGFYFAERKGVNSVAVVAVREDEFNQLEVMLHREINHAHASFRPDNWGAIGGNMATCNDPVAVALTELREEGGYTVTEEDLMPLGVMFSTTQSSEHVYLFAADVSDYEQKDMELEDTEKGYGHDNKWVSFKIELFDHIEDPRFIVAMSRYLNETGR